MKWDSGYIYQVPSFPEEPKENFKVLLGKMEKKLTQNHKTLLDLGCACGEFIYYAKKRFPQLQCSGLDFNEELLQGGRKNPQLHGVNFFQGDITSLKLDKKYDVMTMIGVITCFDDFRPILDSMIANTSKGGLIYIISVFNDEDIDVRLTFRNNPKNKEWQVGYNLFPIKDVLAYAKQKGVQSVSSTEITLPFDIAQKDDPLRSWTINIEGKGRYCANGLMLYYRLKCVEIVV